MPHVHLWIPYLPPKPVSPATFAPFQWMTTPFFQVLGPRNLGVFLHTSWITSVTCWLDSWIHSLFTVYLNTAGGTFKIQVRWSHLSTRNAAMVPPFSFKKEPKTLQQSVLPVWFYLFTAPTTLVTSNFLKWPAWFLPQGLYTDWPFILEGSSPSYPHE